MRFPSLCLVLLASTQALPALDLTLADIPARVRAAHPSLKAARLAVTEAQGRQLGAGRLANPTLSYEYQNQSRVSPQTGVIALDQAFPLTRRLALEKKLSAQLVAAAELEVREAERRLIAEAKSLAVQCLALSQQQALRQPQTELADKLASFAEGRAKAGEVSPLDARQARLDAQKLRVETRQLQAQSLSYLGQLKPLLGLAGSEALTLSGSLPAMKLPAKTAAWQQRPDYLLAQAKQASAQTETDLANAKRRPDVSAGLFASHEMQDVTSTQRERTGFIGFRLSIPLPFWNRNESEIAEKTASAERARLESAALATQISAEAAAARAEMEAHAGIVRETRDTLLPLAAQQATDLQKAYESGQADLLAVLRARDQHLKLQASALDAERDFHLARLRFEAALGTQP